jgi:predicted alpha/beta hydrolase family esterase
MIRNEFSMNFLILPNLGHIGNHLGHGSIPNAKAAKVIALYFLFCSGVRF